jgi:hypothetical protein
VFVTQRLNVPSGGNLVDPNEISVFVDGLGWYVYNINDSDVPTHASFNVYVAAPGQNVWTHFASAANIDPTYQYFTYLSHPRLDGQSSALSLFTHIMNPMGLSGINDPHGKALFYRSDKWTVFHLDTASWTLGAAMNVMLPPDGAKTFFHMATWGSIDGSTTIVDNPWTNDNPAALLFVTKTSYVGNLHPVGVWYNAVTGRWSIINEDGARMVEGSAYSVMVVDIHHAYLPFVFK